jgi:ADP-L-glycero-D-manno-heptose 6-epimerase
MIIVTGANGFIGSNLVRALQIRNGQDVLAVDVLPSIRGQLRPAARVAETRYTQPHPTVTWLDMDSLPAWLDRCPASVAGIIHLGAVSDTTVTDRQRVIRHNVEYTRTLWNWATLARCPFLYASSASTYGDGSKGYSDEADPRQYAPLNLYAESKHMFDLWALEQKTAPPRWAGFKYFNVYGPGEAHKGPMASVAFQAFHQARQTGRVKLFRSHRAGIADGHQRRDFIYVADAVDATLHFLTVPPTADTPNGLYNVGTGTARTFADVARCVVAALGGEVQIEYIDMPEHLREKYQYFTEATVDKLRRAGFHRPLLTLEQGIGRYVADMLTARAA